MKRTGFRKLTYKEALEKRKAKIPRLRASTIAQEPRKPLKVTPKRRKKIPLKKLKEKLWSLCREIQIKKYGRVCYTCGKQDLEGSNCHLGHFIPSSVCSVHLRYELDNLRPQCYHCNINLSGNWINYETHLINEKGAYIINYLKRKNEFTKGMQYDVLWYEQAIAEYTQILESMV